ncbi:hypothetical protein [Persephonella sp.]|uniref:hypothetical protein n=2 Tax=Persephonella sp. TaxID=2060922 RepID=UPI0025CEA5CA|nr:hypothetical protein [Persephonella sp.]
MVIIHNIDDNFVSFELHSTCHIPMASRILSKLKEDLYVDWEFILEELHETVEGGIDRKRIDVMVMADSNKDKMIVVSVGEFDLVAVIPS